MPEKTKEAFLTHYRGLPNNILMTAASWAGVGVDYRGSTKPMMADDYANAPGSTGHNMGLGPVSLADIDKWVVDLYAQDRVSSKQSVPVFNWLRKRNLVNAVADRKRELANEAHQRLKRNG